MSVVDRVKTVRVPARWWNRPSRRPATAAVIIAALAGYGWWATSLPSSSTTTLAAIILPGLALLAVASPATAHRRSIRQWIGENRVRAHELLRRPAGERPRGLLEGFLAWTVVLGAVVVWQLVNFFLHPRADHPTVSSILNTVNTHPVRLIVFLGWLALGWDITRR